MRKVINLIIDVWFYLMIIVSAILGVYLLINAITVLETLIAIYVMSFGIVAGFTIIAQKKYDKLIKELQQIRDSIDMGNQNEPH